MPRTGTPSIKTWVDATALPWQRLTRTRTLDALLAVLVSADRMKVDAGLAQLVDDTAFSGAVQAFGVHRSDRLFPEAYWRGSAWPQLTYLLWLAAQRAGRDDVAATLAGSALTGATRSGLAEHWDPDDGTGLGAVPQSWTGLVLAMNPA